MTNRYFTGIIVFLFVISMMASGCVTAVLVGGGVVGGYALSQDSAEGYVDDKASRVWSVSREVLREKGAIVSEDKEAGKLEASVDGVTVKVNIKELTDKTVKLKVSARKNLLPKVELAQDIYVRIAKRLG